MRDREKEREIERKRKETTKKRGKKETETCGKNTLRRGLKYRRRKKLPETEKEISHHHFQPSHFLLSSLGVEVRCQ